MNAVIANIVRFVCCGLFGSAMFWWLKLMCVVLLYYRWAQHCAISCCISLAWHWFLLLSSARTSTLACLQAILRAHADDCHMQMHACMYACMIVCMYVCQGVYFLHLSRFPCLCTVTIIILGVVIIKPSRCHIYHNLYKTATSLQPAGFPRLWVVACVFVQSCVCI